VGEALINKSMDRDDLLSESGRRFVSQLSEFAQALEERQLPVTSWYGALPEKELVGPVPRLRGSLRQWLRRLRRAGEVERINRGGDAYEPLDEVASDDRHPWFLYWEAYWVMTHGPRLEQRHQVLDAGGTASLFSCQLASHGACVRSVDLNERLVAAGNEITSEMGWNMSSHYMDITDLDFEDAAFDCAYSICVFEHLDAADRQKALREIARVLKPGGRLSLTFDYRGPGVNLGGAGFDYSPENLIRTPDDVSRHFMSSDEFEVVGNTPFHDNGKSYLIWPSDRSQQYTFGAVFLRKRS
jgi:SAM-dependent methyltransferase